MLSNLLTYRFALFNLLAVAGLGFLIVEGIAQNAVAADSTGIVWGIIALFVVAWLEAGRRVVRVSRDLNACKRDRAGYPTSGAEKAKALAKVAWLEKASDWLVGMGLLGTVVGFIIALSGVDETSLASAGGVQISVEHLMSGMRVALYTTLVGGALGIWNEVNVRMLMTAMACYWAKARAEGEADQ